METYHGYVRTPADAIKLFEACRQGLLPRVQRRLSEKERQSIRSGSVFVWDEREAGMRRWTDGKSWSASRVSGSFLTYREMEGKRGGGFGNTRRGGGGKTPDSGRGSDEDQDDGEPDGYRYKADGLMKQSFSITTSNGQHLHLISYYSRPHPGQPEMQQPSTDPSLRGVLPVKGMYPESSLNETPGPALTRTPMQHQPYGPPPPHYQHQQPPHGPPGPYPPYLQHGGYPGWPPSPMATPPYGQHYTVAPPGAPYPPPPHPHSHPPGPGPYNSHPYGATPPHAAPGYERAPLPLPNPVSAAPPPRQGAPTALAPYNHPAHPGASPHSSYTRIKPESPHSPHLVLPEAKIPVGLDPRRPGAGARFPQSGPLPAISTAVRNTTPPRRSSASPPRSSHSDGNPASAAIASASANKASLSALLHPTPTNSEPNSANPESNSAGNSPRHPPGSAGGAGAGQPLMASGLGPKGMQSTSMMGEDQRALSVLDKKFCI